MLFVNKFWSHSKYYKRMIYLILSSIVFIFLTLTQQTFACSKLIIRTKLETCSQLTIKTLEWRHQHRSSVFILNLEQFSHLILVLQLLTLNRSLNSSLQGRMISQTKPLTMIFFPFNFAITEICDAIHLTEDETRMGGI